MRKLLMLFCAGAMLSVVGMVEVSEAAPRWGNNRSSFNRGYRRGTRDVRRNYNRGYRDYRGPSYRGRSGYRNYYGSPYGSWNRGARNGFYGPGFGVYWR